MNIPQHATYIIDTLNKNGYKAYIVGGMMRDILMGKQPYDIDITTQATPDVVKRIFSNHRVVETGIKHGTVTVLIENVPAEITTHRTEAEYGDNRHPDSVKFTSDLYLDTCRRDFTMNAVCYNDTDGIIDYHGGVTDIQNKTIRCIGTRDDRFKEDALRILRAVRFSSVLGFTIEPKTAHAMIDNRNLLKNISAERIYTELSKALCGDYIKDVLLKYTEIFDVIIPGILTLKGFDQKNEHHVYDILEHSAVAVENTPKEPVLRLAALLHDIGKQDTFTIDDCGTGHFYGHSTASFERALAIADRLKMSNSGRDLLLFLVKHHDIQIPVSENSVKRALNKYGEEYLRKLLLLKRADNRGQNFARYNYTEYYNEIENLIENVISDRRCFSIKSLAINGNDLIEIGYPPSKEIGQILADILDLVIDEKLPNEKTALLNWAEKQK